jgi:gamma-glutamyltranspeptidase / glutathione hydrolase
MRKFTVTATFLVASLALASPRYRGGAVATAHPIASKAALTALEQGGNAVDAAVAAALALAVVGPYDSGLGGGGFALVHEASGKAHVLDFREVAPAAARREMFVKNGKVDPALSLDGALAVAVPGAAKGYVELHRRFGKLPLAKVAAPAIAAAKKGFAITPELVDALTERKDCLAADPEAARIFLARDGAVPKAGTLLVQPELARTLETLAAEGDQPFHHGRIARAIAQSVQARGGVLTLADLAAYRTRARAPLEGSYRGHRVLTMPPPSAGGLIVLQTLGVLERKATASLASREPAVLHLFVEALKRAFVDRFRHLGDPAFVNVPVDALLAPAALDKLAASIDPRRASSASELLGPAERAAVAADAGLQGRKHTSHLSVVDKEGGAVALTTTVNYTFGACLVARGTGVLLNDQMDDFAAAPDAPNAYGLVQGEANAIAPGKVPLSSMAPTLVFQKGRPAEVMLAVGSPGGSTIPTTVVQVISHVVDAKLDVAQAVGLGRLHHQLFPESVRVDPAALEPKTQAALEGLGHALKRTGFWGNPQAVMVDPETGLRSAGSDPHREGQALGQE